MANNLYRYPSSVFDGRVEYFPIEDHNVPTFHQMCVSCCIKSNGSTRSDDANPFDHTEHQVIVL